MPAPRDRPQHILEREGRDYPLPPLNAFCLPSMSRETLDIRWSNPGDLQNNAGFSIIGVNIYRSFDSEFGPFFRLNVLPIGSGFWRDRTTIAVESQEDVSQSFTARGVATDPVGRYIFRTRHKPLWISPVPSASDCTNLNVQVTVNGVLSFVDSVDAPTGQVELLNRNLFDVVEQKMIPPILPLNDSDVVLATYMYVTNPIKINLDAKIFYRITAVSQDADGNLIETPLHLAAKCNNREAEKLNYIWAEAVRRNLWMLQQAGERAKVFIRKTVGPRCGCYSSIHKQASSDCMTCFATGIIGGYDGPYDIYLAPADGQNSITQSDKGRSFSRPYDTWTGPSPLLSQRDLVVMLNGDRYGLGPVRMPTSRGMQLQQFFTVSHLDGADIRYQVPVPDPVFLRYPQDRYMTPGRQDANPMVSGSDQIPDDHAIRGNSVAFENEQNR